MINRQHTRALQAITYAKNIGIPATWVGYGTTTVLCSPNYRDSEIERHRDRTDNVAELKRQMKIINQQK